MAEEATEMEEEETETEEEAMAKEGRAEELAEATAGACSCCSSTRESCRSCNRRSTDSPQMLCTNACPAPHIRAMPRSKMQMRR